MAPTWPKVTPSWLRVAPSWLKVAPTWPKWHQHQSSRVKHEVDRALRPAALTKKEETSSDKKVVRKVMFKLEE